MTQLTKLVLSVLLVALVTGLSLLVNLQYRMQVFKDELDIGMQQAVVSLKQELQDRIVRIQTLTELFSREQANLIQRFYDNQNDQLIRQQFQQKLARYFPDFYTFALAEMDGVPVLGEVGKTGNLCRQDLTNYANVALDMPHAYTPNIHFSRVPEGYSRHFDVMTSWESSDSGILFISIQESYLQKSMRRHERSGFQLVLLKTSDKNQVELGSHDSVVQKKRKRLLTDEEVKQINFLAHIDGTLWDVAAMPAQDYIADQLESLRLQTLYMWGFAVLVSAILVGLWRREAMRRRALVVLNKEMASEVELRRQTESELRKLTNYDPLTTLPNRKSIDEYIGHVLAMADEEGHRPAVLFFDLDRFQDLNDSMGHGYGDVMLKEVANRLKSMVKPQDMLARWGGDEFVVIMQNAHDENEVAHFANELLLAMRQPIQLHRHAVTATISIGISIYPEAGIDAETLLKNADLAMYRAKNEGRDRFRFFLQEMDDIANERILLESRIRKAIRNNEFEPYFQPRMNMRTGKIIGCEALLRWQDSESVLLPAVFMSTLEETGMIEAVGDAVREKVCQCHTKWLGQGVDVGTISVNLGGKEFARKDIVGHLANAMLRCGLQASQFEIEITEGHLMENTTDSLGKLHALKSMGFSIAVDDFGTGYSSLAYLKRFPVDVLKIDRSFIVDCVTSPEDQEIIRTIITLAHSLDLRVVAEGVETVAQMDILRGMKCDELQGYIIGKPMQAEGYLDFVMDKNRMTH